MYAGYSAKYYCTCLPGLDEKKKKESREIVIEKQIRKIKKEE